MLGDMLIRRFHPGPVSEFGPLLTFQYCLPTVQTGIVGCALGWCQFALESARILHNATAPYTIMTQVGQ